MRPVLKPPTVIKKVMRLASSGAHHFTEMTGQFLYLERCNQNHQLPKVLRISMLKLTNIIAAPSRMSLLDSVEWQLEIQSQGAKDTWT